MNSKLRFCFLCLLAVTFVATASGQRLLATVPIGGSPLNVAVNPSTEMIYVSQVGSNSVAVVDGTTNSVVANVPAGGEPWAIWVYIPANLVYVYNQLDRTVTVINGKTNAVLRTIPIQYSIDSATVLGLSKWLYAADNGNSQVHVIDLTSFKDVVDIPVVAAPTYIAANTAAKLVYVSNGFGGSPITVIDTVTNSVVGSFSVGIGINAYSLSADPINNLLYVATGTVTASSQASVTILNATTGEVLGVTQPLGTVTQVLALPSLKRAVVSGGKLPGQYTHSLVFIDSQTFSVSAVLSVGKEPEGLGFNPFTRTIYAATYLGGALAVIGN